MEPSSIRLAQVLGPHLDILAQKLWSGTQESAFCIPQAKRASKKETTTNIYNYGNLERKGGSVVEVDR